ncbi:hypothetical protein [Bradyrhizobium neotropicale]|uniref:hypothetical protein n=1 Tax=Bradyrhizobium neotropicale TaxID=1497615 RepID=UPI001AD78722|nr:hypothetical protein [Bradyrhizobium neotropicale]MBO4224034.1 hypothetical protein [Bradyrhizobium neotropicale]
MRWLSKANLEVAIDLWHRFKGRAMSRRAGYLIAAAVALEADLPQLIVQGGFKAAGVDLVLPETPHWVSVSFVGFAVLLLFGDRYLPEAHRASPNPHDVELYAKFRKLFDDDVMYFLRTHDFGGGSFSGKYFNVFDEVSAVWVGSRYNFDDSKMSKIWEELFPKNRQLLRLIADNTDPTGRDWCRPHWAGEDWPSDETTQRVKLMNDTATQLAELVDKLEAEARRKWISTPAG